VDGAQRERNLFKAGPAAADEGFVVFRQLLASAVLSLAISLCGAGVACAQAPQAPTPLGLPLAAPASDVVPPPGFQTNARQALAIAEATPTVRRLRREHPDLRAHAYVWGSYRWEVDFGLPKKDLAEVDVSGAGAVVAVWTGLQVDSYFARGHFGGLFDSPWVLIPFCLLFVLPFVDFRRRPRLLYLDLLVLLSFGVSYFLFTKGMVNWSVPLVYPPLVYLLARMLIAGFRGHRLRGRLVPHLPTAALAIGLVVLVGARIAINIEAKETVDVAYASVIGADRIWHHQVLYVNHAVHGDTYGPVTYLAYVPFERAFPWHGAWDFLPASHAAAIFFDLLTIVGLFLLGRQLRAGPTGRRLGLALAWAWAAYPFTLLGLVKNTNDGLVAMLVVYALLAFRSPVGRGALLGLAAAAKFSPAAMLPLFAAGDGERNWRRTASCAAAFVAVVVFAIWMYLPPQGVSKFYDATIGFQIRRSDIMSLWGLHPTLKWLQTVIEAGAVGLALFVGFARKRRSLAQVAALGAAVTIAVQVPAMHWFYFYIVWFFPLVLVALFAGERRRSEELPAMGKFAWDSRIETPEPVAALV
jgi:hypothetical protein